ncbi:Holliday junction resolvase RuvX [Candidatus Thioglobus sp.]|uniref:Holliday junction resolvase RuvX n=1 Tax=Candidatus Thioglobus sp. TaxID=2026721 RepID=UPI0026027502|nr:Holliday junction resolvase RuvX [Candidatus Thioglobus sp.]MDG2395848.1 Holliday junction resolvase RuvX [Candidatus Thioglobus sp.]
MNIDTYLGFDVGTKRTGVAIANSLTQQANGIDIVSHHKNGATNWNDFDAIINQHAVSLFVVGIPYDKNGQEQEMTFIARSFGRKLSARYDIKTVFVDEYLSSNEAKKQLKYNHHHKNANRAEVDKLSAALILQTWLEDL